MVRHKCLILHLFLAAFLFSVILSLPAHAAPADKGSPMYSEAGTTHIEAASTDPLDNWVWRNPLPQPNLLSGVAYGNNIYVAVGYYDTILTSPDGETWTSRLSGMGVRFTGVAYGNNMFVAVGCLWGNTVKVLTSPDGVTWTEAYSKSTYLELHGVTYGNDKFVAVGDDTVLTSPDGVTWTETFLENGTSLTGVAYGNGTFVAVGSYGEVLTSPDGVKWTHRSSGMEKSFSGIAYAKGLFVAVGDYAVFTSPDGVTWTKRIANDHVLFKGVAYGNGTFVTVGYTTGPTVPGLYAMAFTSPDGVTWADRLRFAIVPGSLLGVAYGNNLFVAVGGAGAIFISPDGETWTKRDGGMRDLGLKGIAYGNSTFVAVGSRYTSESTILTSPDGVAWTDRVPRPASKFNGVTYAVRTFVAVGTGGAIATSPDGVTWTERDTGTGAELRSVVYGGNKFVAGGYEDTILTSPDGATWTLTTTGTGENFQGITYGNGTYVALSVGGASYISPDGVTWTRRPAPLSLGITWGVAYGNGTFVAVGEDGITTSPDGVTWTRRSTGTYGGFYAVTYADNTFVAVRTDVYTSPDGVTWTRRFPGMDFRFNAVAYGAKSFVAVGEVGAILQSIGGKAYPLTITKSGAGNGAVTSDPPRISCGDTCSSTFTEDTKVTLTATASSGSTVKSWSGCVPSSGGCVVAMKNARSVTVKFDLADPVRLTVGKVKRSDGDGTVTSADGKINCGRDCVESYVSGASVTLTASPATLSTFLGWSVPACTGVGPCTFPVEKKQTVKATFMGPQTLTVTNISASRGKGTVTSVPEGVNCGKTCRYKFAHNVSVVLSAVPESGSYFAGWSPDSLCSGTGDCTVVMDKAKSVTAKFKKGTGPAREETENR